MISIIIIVFQLLPSSSSFSSSLAYLCYLSVSETTAAAAAATIHLCFVECPGRQVKKNQMFVSLNASKFSMAQSKRLSLSVAIFLPFVCVCATTDNITSSHARFIFCFYEKLRTSNTDTSILVRTLLFASHTHTRPQYTFDFAQAYLQAYACV